MTPNGIAQKVRLHKKYNIKYSMINQYMETRYKIKILKSYFIIPIGGTGCIKSMVTKRKKLSRLHFLA